MKKISLLCLIILTCFGYGIYGQVNINGKITDVNLNPVHGTSIRLLNSNKGVVSNPQGNFTINNVSPGNYIIEFSAIGFASKNQGVIIGKQPVNIQISLEQTSYRLDQVVVTAQKREELLQKVPVSITSLSEKNITDYRLWNSKDITGIVPNLYSSDPGDKRNVTSIRGITTTSYDPAVATYIDGVNQFGLDTYISPLFDVARIEILRGPQGTLYGRNAMGGVINIITKQPTNKTSGFAELSLGNYGQQRYSAGMKTPLVKDKLFFGAAALYDGLDGYYTNEFNNSKYDKQHSIIGNYFLKFLANQKWVVTLNVKHNNNRNHGPFPLVFGIDNAFAMPYKLSQNALTKIIDNIFNTSLSVNYAASAFNFESQTAWQSNYRYYNTPIDADFSPIDGVTIINNYGSDFNTVKVLTQEIKFSSPAADRSPLKWTTGTYLFLQNNPGKQATRFGDDALLVGAPDVDFSLINTTKAKGKGIAVYGQATYSIIKKLEITGGLRYDYENKDQKIFGEYQKDGDAPFPYRTDTSASAHFTAFTPKLSVAYNLSDNHLLFATYSKGYRAGGLTPLASDPSQPALYAFKPEYSNNFEAGIKNIFLADQLMLNFTAFYTTITNAQVPTLILPDAVTITKNTGKLTSKGVEAEVNAAPVKGLQINYSAGYTDAKYKKLKLSQNGEEADLKGKRQIFTPDFTSMLAAQYSFPLCKKHDIDLVLRGEWKYLGTQYFDLANALRQSPYSLLNTRIGIATKNFEIMFYGRNLSGKKYIAYAYDFGAVHLGDPKTYGLSLKGKF
ncbi:MAG: TonB-dependent receptor [Ginsengibacter sp.]